MVNFDKTEFAAGVVVGASIIGMVVAFMLSLAVYASKPAAHPASYAVSNISSHDFNPVRPDQMRATFVSLSGSAPGHLFTENNNE